MNLRIIILLNLFLQIREALESDNEDSNFSGSGNYGEDDEDDNLNVNKGGKFNLFEERNKVKPNKDSKNSIQHSSGDGTDQRIDNDDEDDDHISRTPDDDEDDLYIEKTTNTDPISPPFTDNEDSQLHVFILFIYYLLIIDFCVVVEGNFVQKIRFPFEVQFSLPNKIYLKSL